MSLHLWQFKKKIDIFSILNIQFLLTALQSLCQLEEGLKLCLFTSFIVLYTAIFCYYLFSLMTSFKNICIFWIFNMWFLLIVLQSLHKLDEGIKAYIFTCVTVLLTWMFCYHLTSFMATFKSIKIFNFKYPVFANSLTKPVPARRRPKTMSLYNFYSTLYCNFLLLSVLIDDFF